MTRKTKTPRTEAASVPASSSNATSSTTADPELTRARAAALEELDAHVTKLREEYGVTDEALMYVIVPGTTVADKWGKRREEVRTAGDQLSVARTLQKAKDSVLLSCLAQWAKGEIRGAATAQNLERHAQRAEALAGLLESRGNEDGAAKQRERAAALRRGETPTKITKVTSAGRFRELILEGKLDDDAIFATVAKEFGVDSSHRNYVQWYRKDLVRKGLLTKDDARATVKVAVALAAAVVVTKVKPPTDIKKNVKKAEKARKAANKKAATRKRTVSK